MSPGTTGSRINNGPVHYLKVKHRPRTSNRRQEHKIVGSSDILPRSHYVEPSSPSDCISRHFVIWHSDLSLFHQLRACCVSLSVVCRIQVLFYSVSFWKGQPADCPSWVTAWRETLTGLSHVRTSLFAEKMPSICLDLNTIVDGWFKKEIWEMREELYNNYLINTKADSKRQRRQNVN